MNKILGIGIMLAISSVNSILEKEKAKNKMTIEKLNVETFLENPTNYTFICSDTSDGEVLAAQLGDEGKMTIDYKSIWPDGDHSGKVVGKFHEKNNQFIGRYKTNDNRFEGEINFKFNKNGEANGSWDHGFGTIKIGLKKN